MSAMSELRTISRSRRRGIVLLETVFALALFVGGASVILSGISACVRSVQRMEAETVADDLIVTLLSEVRMELVPPQDDGPNEYEEPYLGWTWQIVTSEFQDVIEAEGPEMVCVEIIVSNADAGCERRLTLLVVAPDEEELPDEDSDAPLEPVGGTRP